MSIRRRDTEAGRSVRRPPAGAGWAGGSPARSGRSGRPGCSRPRSGSRRCSGAGGSTRALQSTPFADVAAEWLDSNLSKRPSTLARDDVTLRRHLLPDRWATRPVGQITAGSEVQALDAAAGLAERKPSSVARDDRTLAAIFQLRRRPGATSPGRRAGAGEAPEGPTAGGTSTSSTPRSRPGWRRRWASTARWPTWPPCLGLRWGEVAGLRVGRPDLDRSGARGRGAGHPGPGRADLPRGARSRTPAGGLLAMPTPLLAELPGQRTWMQRGLARADAAASVFAAPGRRAAPLRQPVPPGLGTGRSRPLAWRASPSTTSGGRTPPASSPPASTSRRPRPASATPAAA